jgi:prepilin peptidase CpaA
MSTFLVIAVAVSAVAAAWDMRTGRIPNWLTLGALAVGFFGHLTQSWLTLGSRAALASAAWSVGGAVFCALAPLALYWKGGMGGGDLKLFAAIGALCHPMLGIECQVYALVVAALLAPAKLAYDGRLFAVLAGSLALLVNPLLPPARRRVLPPEMRTWFRLGPAIFGGTLLTLVVHAHEILAARI